MNDSVDGSVWVGQAKIAFAFLQRPEYDFRQLEETYNPANPSYGLLKCTSPQGTAVQLSGDARDQIYLEIASDKCSPSIPNETCVFDLATAIEWLDRDIYESVRDQVFLASYPLTLEGLRQQFAIWAQLLERYCQPILTGEFNDWDAMAIHKQEMVRRFTSERLPDLLLHLRKQMGL